MNTHTPHNHEDFETLLMDYAAGMLNEAHNLFVSSYITVSPQARHTVRKYETAGGILMESCSPATMAANSLHNVLERLTERPTKNTEQNTVPEEEEYWPAPIQKYVVSRRWRYVVPGIKALDIPVTDCRSKVLLMKARPGAKLPTHEHRGKELTLVLDGIMHDENGTYQRGDVLIKTTGSVHTPVADPHTGCLSLTIIDVPVRLRKFHAFFKIIIKY